MQSIVSDKLFSFVSNEADMIQSRKKSLYKSLSKYQKDILETHKKICLLPYYMFIIENKKHQKPSEQTYMPAISDSDLILTLFNQKKGFLSGFTMMSQESSFLIEYIGKNPTELAREVVKSKTTLNNLDYYHMMFQIIPSIFGYFHSQEHLCLASNFYQSVIDFISDNPNASIRIIQPFLNSPATYRYIEYVMTKIFKKITLCDLFNKFTTLSNNDTSSSLYKEYVSIRNEITKKFLHCLSNGVSLLPDQILQIFRRIRNKHNNKWSTQNWYKLVFSVFIGPHFTRWARCHFFNKGRSKLISQEKLTDSKKIKRRTSTLPKKPISMLPHSFPSNYVPNVGIINEYYSTTVQHKIDFINEILINVLNNSFDNDLQLFINSLCRTKSIYSVPQLYKCFDKCSIKYNVMAKDMLNLVDFMEEKKILPSFVKTSKFQGLSDDSLNAFFDINVYQNETAHKQIIDKPIIFKQLSIDNELNQKFEKNEYKSKLASLESLARRNDKNAWLFAFEQSSKDDEFHQYVKNQITIQYANTTESFEEYIESKRLLDEIVDWNKLLTIYLNSTFLAYLYHLQKMPVVIDLLPNKVKLLNQMEIVSEAKFNVQFNQYKNMTNDLDEYINDLVSRNQKLNEHSVINGTDSNQNNDAFFYFPFFFCEAFSLFSMIHYVRLPEKYNIFMDFLDIINTHFPKNDNTLFLMLLKQITPSVLIKVFIEISTYAIHNEKCFGFIPTTDISKWQRLENLIYETISDNFNVFQQVLKCQIQFQDNFASKNSCVRSESLNIKKNKRSLISHD